MTVTHVIHILAHLNSKNNTSFFQPACRFVLAHSHSSLFSYKFNPFDDTFKHYSVIDTDGLIKYNNILENTD